MYSDCLKKTVYPLVSIIMPVYNSEQYIGRAIASVLDQTYSNIELVICDDCSTDRTVEVISEIKDSRIILCKEETNSGSAYIPRKHALDICKGDLVINLDSDDYLEHNYIEKMVFRLQSTSSDVCCSRMVLINENGKELGGKHIIPKSDFNFSIELSGREAFFYTVPNWNIGMNGCLALKKVWNAGYNKTSKEGKRGIHDDENVSRLLLLNSEKVVFCNVKYFYTINTKSVTHIFNDKIFDWMITESDLLSIIEREYGKESIEYKKVECNDFYAFHYASSLFVNTLNTLKNDDIHNYMKKLKKWHGRINWIEVKKQASLKYYLLNRIYIVKILFLLLYKKKYKQILRIF